MPSKKRVAAVIQRDGMEGRISFRCDDRLKDEMQEEAAAVGLHLGAWIRMQLTRVLWPKGKRQ